MCVSTDEMHNTSKPQKDDETAYRPLIITHRLLIHLIKMITCISVKCTDTLFLYI